MKFNVKRTLSVLAVLVVALLSFAAVTYASDDTVELPHFNDGRVNNFDINAPVAIFPVYTYPYADDVNMGVLDHIEFWGYVYSGSDTIDKVLEVTAEQIQATDNSVSSALVASAYGYALYLETDDSLTLVAPTTPEGVTYQFNWEQSD